MCAVYAFFSLSCIVKISGSYNISKEKSEMNGPINYRRAQNNIVSEIIFCFFLKNKNIKFWWFIHTHWRSESEHLRQEMKYSLKWFNDIHTYPTHSDTQNSQLQSKRIITIQKLFICPDRKRENNGLHTNNMPDSVPFIYVNFACCGCTRSIIIWHV